MKKALITGVTGQDGSYLAELLLDQGYEVYGLVRQEALEDPNHRMERFLHIRDKLKLSAASLESFPSIFKIIQDVKPDEIYHLAAQSFVSYSFDDKFSPLLTNISGTHYALSSCKSMPVPAKFYFAGSSEMFGKVDAEPQNESTPFHPRSPYGISKVAGFHLTRNYRESYEMFACNGILFNHESPRRGFEFVTRKITSGVAKIKFGLADRISLGNLNAKRDWGFAGDYVKAMWLMLQQEKPDDYVIATGHAHTVREFVELSFKTVDMEILWEGKGIHEKGIDEKSGRVLVDVNKEFFRPDQVHVLRGDYTKAKRILNWEPTIQFHDLVPMMVEADCRLFSQDKMR